MSYKPIPPLECGYTNWCNEYAQRRIHPMTVFHTSNEWHPQEQWMLQAIDADKGEIRVFAMKDLVLAGVPRHEHDRRVTELLEANNREVERRREAERQADKVAASVLTASQDFQLMLARLCRAIQKDPHDSAKLLALATAGQDLLTRKGTLSPLREDG